MFVTWRLAGTLPALARELLAREKNAGKRFVEADRELDRNASGPRWLKDPRIADMLVDALRHGEEMRGMYEMYAWVVMPNHIHLVLEPKRKLPEIVSWLKRATAVRANELLGLTGTDFWHREYYDHWIRTEKEFGNIIRYVEQNPVKAGLIASAEDWKWSSAFARRQQDCQRYDTCQ